MPFDLPQQGGPGPQVQIRYNFVLHPDGGVLQENPSSCWPEQGTNLQAFENEPPGSGENVSMFSQTGNSNAAFQPQEGFWQPDEMTLTAGQGNPGPASEHHVSGLGLLLGDDLRTGGCCGGDDGVGEASIHQGARSPSCNGSEESANQPPSSVLLERLHTGETLCSCPLCGRVFSLNRNPVTHQLLYTYKCPSCGYLFSCYTPGSVEGHQVSLPDDCERLFRQLDLSHSPNTKAGGLEKRFHCPECGRGFVHKSSIPRHQKRHRKESLLQNSGQEKSCGPTGNQLYDPKAQSRKSPLSSPDGRPRSAGKERDRFAALCETCGQSFSLAHKFQRHLATHSQEKPFCCCHCGKMFGVKSVLVRHLLLHQPEKPFRCRYCDKSYIQKSHLKRHFETSHGVFE